jgi:KDO2-lipid IV(A) lauroyltransferase
VAKSRSALRNRAEAAVFALLAGWIRMLPRTRAEAVGCRLGLLFRLLARRRRELAERNLARAFPGKGAQEIERLSRGAFAHFGGVTADLVLSLDEPVDSMLERIEVENAECARTAMDSGRGVLFVTSHFGNWELGAISTAARARPLTVIVRPLDNPLLDAILTRFRERTGNRVLPKREAAREILRVLRSGGTIGIVADQHARPPDAVVVPFLGRPASTTNAVARLADRTEALILPGAAARIAPGRYRLTFGEPIDVRTLSPAERETETLTARVNRRLEEPILAHPEQWLWLHDRWRLD